MDYQEARQWILECLAEDDSLDDEDAKLLVAAKTDEQILKWMQRWYEGGWRQFLIDIED